MTDFLVDDFATAGTGTINGRQAPTGGTWDDVSGTMNAVSGDYIVASIDNARMYNSVTLPSDVFSLEATVLNVGGGTNTILFGVRSLDLDDWTYFQFSGTTPKTAKRVNAGSFVFTDLPTVSIGVQHVLRMDINGPAGTADYYVNGVWQAQITGVVVDAAQTVFIGGVVNQGRMYDIRGFYTASGPSLTLPTLTPTGETTMTGTVTTDTATGTMYAYVSTSATAPSAADLKAGTGAVWSGSQAISTTGEKTFSVTGLTADTTYHIYYLHNDGTDDSSIATASATTNAAATGPSLSAASGTATSAATADGSVTTDTGNGTLYAVVTQSATAPSVAQVQAGQDHTGAGADWFDSQAVSTTGAKTFEATGLEAETTYYFHFQHLDTTPEDSTVVSSASFTTQALLGWTVDPAVSAVTTNSITVTATPNQTADVYGVAVLAGSAAPSSAQVIAGQNAAGTAAEAADSDLNVTGAATLVLNSTLDDPLYDVYVVATTA